MPLALYIVRSTVFKSSQEIHGHFMTVYDSIGYKYFLFHVFNRYQTVFQLSRIEMCPACVIVANIVLC